MVSRCVPDGAYAALQLPSLLGESKADLWLLDLRQQRARMVRIGDMATSLAWRDDRLIIGSSISMQLSLTNGKISPFPILPQEARP